MASDSTRKLVAALAAILSGASAFTEAQREEEERQRREREREEDRQFRERNMALNEKWYDRSIAQDEARLEAEKKREIDTANTTEIDRMAQLAGDRAYSNVSDTAGVQMAGGGRVRPSESIPLGLGDGRIDMDLTTRLNRIRSGGTLDRAGAVSEVATRAREDAASREAGITQGIAAANREEIGTRGERVATARAMAEMQRAVNPPQGPAPERVGSTEDAINGDARLLASQGKPAHEIASELAVKYRKVNPSILLNFAIDAVEEWVSGADRRITADIERRIGLKTSGGLNPGGVSAQWR